MWLGLYINSGNAKKCFSLKIVDRSFRQTSLVTETNFQIRFISSASAQSVFFSGAHSSFAFHSKLNQTPLSWFAVEHAVQHIVQQAVQQIRIWWDQTLICCTANQFLIWCTASYTANQDMEFGSRGGTSDWGLLRNEMEMLEIWHLHSVTTWSDCCIHKWWPGGGSNTNIWHEVI